MQNQNKELPAQSAPGIRVVNINTDKTRKVVGSTDVYHVNFELSGHPTPVWREIFGREWKRFDQTHAANLDGGFVVLESRLSEVAQTLFPALKKAVSATNAEYIRRQQKEAVDNDLRENVWKEERRNVESLAATLHFE